MSDRRLTFLCLLILAMAPAYAFAQGQATAPVGSYVNARSAIGPARAAFASELYARIRARSDQSVMQAAQRLASDTARRIAAVNPGRDDIVAAICNRDFNAVFTARLPDFDQQMTAVIASVFSDGEVATIQNAQRTGAALPPVTREKFNTDMGISNASLVWISQVTSEVAMPQLVTDLRANNLVVPQELTQAGPRT